MNGKDTAHRRKGTTSEGKKADICSAPTHVRFTANSDRESGHRQTVMSALPPKADMCGAPAHVCFGPKADSCTAAKRIVIRSPRRRSAEGAKARRGRAPWRSLG